MTVEFALFISPEGIALAHRQAAGHWALIAEARLDEGDLDAAMAGLRQAAEARGGPKAPVLVVLPDDQVLYTSFTAPAEDAALVADRIAEGLDGMTPYAVAELVHDWRAVDIDRVKVAVVAKETLGEATEFVAAHGFVPAGFAAMPPAERFPGMPLFGDTRADWGLDGLGMAFGADDWTDPALAEPEATQPEEADTDTATPAEVATEAEAGASAPQTEAAADAPQGQPGGPEIDLGVDEPTAPATAPEPTPAENAATAASQAPATGLEPPPPPGPDAAARDAAEAGPEPEPELPKSESGNESESEGESEPPLTPIADLSLGQPIAPLPAEDEAETAEDRAAQADAQDPAPKPQPGPDVPPPMATPRPPKPETPTATRGKATGGTRRFSIDLPPDPQTEASPLGMETETGAETDTDGAAPALGFAARKGKAPRPDGGAGDIVSTRRSRLGFGTAKSGEAAPTLHPDAAPTRAAGAALPRPPAQPQLQPQPRAGQAPAKPAGRLATQLARVRDASKARLQPGAGRDAGPDRPVTAPPPRPAPPAAATAPTSDGAAMASSSQASGDTALTRGLLARKPVDQAGPSFRTGLILTLVLLVLLAMIAVWSALFLPDSPMARLFSGGSDRDSAALSDPLPDTPPLVVTAPPAIGELDSRDTAPPAPDDAAPDLPAASTEPPPAPAALPEVAAVLPDIDADLDLPPLDPLPEDRLPSVEETERIYAEDGIWPRPPERPDLGPLGNTTEIYVASIDPDVPAIDAIALLDPGIDTGEVLRRVPPPPPFGATPDRDAQGLVTPTPEGVLTPEGAFVVLGRPPVEAQPRPRDIAPPPEPTQAEPPAGTIEDAILGTFTPQPRPVDLEETRQRQVQGGFSDSELAGLRPDPRPVSAQDAAARASLFPQADSAAPGDDSAAATFDASDLAVAASRVPTLRPGNIAALAAAAEAQPGPAVAPEQVARAPSIPSSADVTRAATETNAIRLRDINLIGVTGTPSDRRALVRLPSGRFVRVAVGDRLDGGRVAAIGEGSLQYVRNGRNVTLEIPG